MGHLVFMSWFRGSGSQSAGWSSGLHSRKAKKSFQHCANLAAEWRGKQFKVRCFWLKGRGLLFVMKDGSICWTLTKLESVKLAPIVTQTQRFRVSTYKKIQVDQSVLWTKQNNFTAIIAINLLTNQSVFTQTDLWVFWLFSIFDVLLTYYGIKPLLSPKSWSLNTLRWVRWESALCPWQCGSSVSHLQIACFDC